MLNARYLLLHKALGLGPMWLKKGACLHPTLMETKEDAPFAVQASSISAVKKNLQQIASPSLPTKETNEQEAVKILTPIEIQTEGKNLGTLENECLICHACVLSNSCRQPIFGQGNTQAELFILSSSPTPEDDLTGILFHGKTGELLSNMLKAIDINLEDTYLTSILKCAPGFGMEVTEAQHKTCFSFLNAQLKLVTPKAILVLGSDLTDLKKEQQQGNFYPHAPIFTTPHPARLMRHPQEKKEAWNELKKLKQYLIK